MMKTGIKLLVGLCLCSIYSQAQLSYAQADSATLSMYHAKDWVGLANLGEELDKDGMDYYYIHLRTGSAFYELGEYYKAEKYFQKALNKNEFSNIAKSAVFWCRVMKGQSDLANHQYSIMNKKAREGIELKRVKPVDNIFAEFGIMTNTDPIYYGLGALTHRFSYRTKLTHAFTFLNRSPFWGSFNDFGYYISPTITLNKGWQITPAFSISKFSGTLSYADTTAPPIDTIPPLPPLIQTYNGAYDQLTLVFMASANKTIGRLNIGLEQGIFGKINTPDYTFRVLSPLLGPDQTIDTAGNSVHFQTGVSASYVLPVWKDRITIGTWVRALYDADSIGISVQPFLALNLVQSLYLYADYMFKDGHPVAIRNGLTNFSFDEINQRVNASLIYYINPKLSVSLGYQFLNRTDATYLTDDTFHSIFTQINIKL